MACPDQCQAFSKWMLRLLVSALKVLMVWEGPASRDDLVSQAVSGEGSGISGNRTPANIIGSSTPFPSDAPQTKVDHYDPNMLLILLKSLNAPWI